MHHGRKTLFVCNYSYWALIQWINVSFQSDNDRTFLHEHCSKSDLVSDFNCPCIISNDRVSLKYQVLNILYPCSIVN